MPAPWSCMPTAAAKARTIRAPMAARRGSEIVPRKAGEGDRAQRGGGGVKPAGDVRAPKETIHSARRLRRRLSVPEVRLWIRLRARSPGQPIFRRQHSLGSYVLDFYCPAARLAVEVDGMSHDMGGTPLRDARRDVWLRKEGVTVM